MFKQIQRWALLVAVAVAAMAVVSACGDSSSDATSAGTDSGGGATTTPVAETKDVPDVPFDSPESGLPIGYPERERKGDLTIGLLNPRGATESLTVLYDAARKRIESFGGKVIELDAELSPDRQVSQFEQLVNERVDAIGITPIAEPKLIGAVLKKAEKAGIPVIGLEVTPGIPKKAPGFTSQVWQRRDYMTYLKVKAAAEMLGTGAKIGEIGFALPVPLFNFTEERTAHWAEKFGLEIVDIAKADNDSVDAGQEAAEGLLARNPDIAGVIGYNDEPAIGATLAAKAAGRDVKTFGNGGGSLGLEAIAAGRLTATVLFDSASEGRTLADGLFDAAQGLKVPPVVLTGEPFVVTADNLDEAREAIAASAAS